MNCMEVFHYVANQLQGEPIFDTPIHSNDGHRTAPGTGAIYNDFDFDPSHLMYADEVESFSFSQSVTSSQPLNRNEEETNDNDNNNDKEGENSALVQALDHAVLEADKEVGIHYEDLVWESDLFDNYSEKCDEAYVDKVLVLAANKDGAWDKLKVTEKAKNMFRRRLRNKWEGADSVYDAWLIRKGCERPWFDYHFLYSNHPDFDPNAEKEPATQVSQTYHGITDSPIRSYQKPRVPETDDDDMTDDERAKEDHPKPKRSTVATPQSCGASSSGSGGPAREASAVQEPKKSPTKVTTVPETPTKLEANDESKENTPPTPSLVDAKSRDDESSDGSDTSIQTDTLEDPPAANADGKTKITGKRPFRLSLYRCTHSQSAQSQPAITLSSPSPPKKVKSDSESSIEFDIDREINPDATVIKVSSSSDDTD